MLFPKEPGVSILLKISERALTKPVRTSKNRRPISLLIRVCQGFSPLFEKECPKGENRVEEIY